MSVAPDGAVWLTMNGGVARYARGAFSAFAPPQADPNGDLFEGMDPLIVVGPDNAAYTVGYYFQNFVSSYAYWMRFAPNGSSTLGGLTGYDSINDLKIGPDNRLYAAAFASGNGYVVQEKLPFFNESHELQLPGTPQGVAAGEDGTIWVAADALYRISTALKITARYKLPIKTGPCCALVWGPDDALWFPDPDNNSIARITTTGILNEFRILTPASFPDGLTVGGDGALWFTELNGNKIGRITTSGRISEYRIPTANSRPLKIAAPKPCLDAHTLWFVETSANKLGEVKF